MEALQSKGNNLFTPTQLSGEPIVGIPLENVLMVYFSFAGVVANMFFFF